MSRIQKIRTILEGSNVNELSLPKSFHNKGRAVASILAKKHDKLADKRADSTGTDFGRHIRAARRFAKIAAGRKPFSESRVHGRFKIGDKISTKIGKQITGKIEALHGNYVHFRNPEQNENNPKGKLYKTHLTNIKKHNADKRK